MSDNQAVVGDEFISQKEAAELLGVHTRTIYRAAKNRQITYKKTPGGWLRVLRSDVLALRKPVARIEPQDETETNNGSNQ